MAYNILKGNPFSEGSSPPDGYFLAWNGFTSNWEAREGPSGSFSAGGDLTGSSSSQTITAIRGKFVDTSLATLGPAENNYVLTWLDSDGYWAARDPGSSTFTAAGDLSGNSSTQTVIRINGATVPVSGSLVTGNVLRVSGASSLTYAAVNLAGGANHVTGVLPSANQAAQTMGGDVSGTTATATVININGTSVPATPTANRVLVATSGTTAIWSQIYDGYIAASANITGSKIQQTSVSNLGVIQLGGDLDGSASSQVVKAIQTYPVNAVAPTDGYVLTWDQPDGYWAPRPAASNTPDATASIKGKVRLTNDLGGTADAPLVTGLQSYDISSAAPSDGYVLTWINADGYWAPKPGPSGSFAAGGDLSGSSTNQTVIGIQTNDVAAQTLGAADDGYILTWENVDGYWAARPPTTFTAGGDLSGTNTSQTVEKINGTSVPSGPSANRVLVATSGTTSVWSQIYDGYVAPSANIAGSKIQQAGTVNYGVIQIGGDLDGSASSQVVRAIQTHPVHAATPTDGYVLTWINADGYWAPRPTADGTPTGAAGGDLSGTYPNPTVNKIEGNDVYSQALSASDDGYILTWDGVDGYWIAKPNAGGSGFTAGGDLTGSSSNQTVVAIRTKNLHSTLSSIGSESDGYVLTWDGVDGYWLAQPSAAGNGSPTGSAGGDLSGTYPNPTVAKIRGYNVNASTPADGYALIWSGADGYWAPRSLSNARYTPTSSDSIINWKFEESGSPYLNTGSGSALTLTTFTGTPTSVTGIFDKALGCTNTTLSTGNSSVNEPSGTAVTVSAWVKARTFATNAVIMNKAYRNDNTWSYPYTSLYLSLNNFGDGSWGPAITISGTLYQPFQGGAFRVPLYQWTLLAFTYDGSNLRSYINGALAGTTSAPGSIDYGTHGPWDIGGVSNASTGQHWDGHIDDVRVENVVRSEEYLRNMYLRGVGQDFSQQTQVASGDLSGTYPSPTVVKIQNKSLNSSLSTIGAAQDGYALVWDNDDGYWKAGQVAASGPPTGSAGGDLSGTYPNPTVAKIRGNTVASQTLGAANDGYVLTWKNTDGYWAASPSAGGGGSPTGSAGGDLSGTYPNPTVSKLEGNNVYTQVLGVNEDGYVLTWDGDGYWIARNIGDFGSQNISTTGVLTAGSAATTSLNTALINLPGKLVMPGIPTSSTLSNLDEGVIYFDSTLNVFRVSQNGNTYANFITDGYTAGGDLSGTYPNPTVAKIRGNTVATQTLGASNDGYVLTWSNSDGYWKANPAASGFTAGGDLSGTSTNQTVIRIQNDPVYNHTLTSAQDGYVLTWKNTDGYWTASPSSGSPTGSAGGDLSGTYPNPTVAKIQGRSVNSAAPTDGYVLTWSNTDGYWAPRPLFTTQESNPFYYGYTTGSLAFTSTTWANVTAVATGFTDGYKNGITRSGSSFTIPKTGYYYINSYFNTYGTASYVAFRLRHSSGTILQHTDYNNNSQGPGILQGIVYLTSGESYSVQYVAKGGTPGTWLVSDPIDGESMRTGEITIYYLPTESIRSPGDGYQHLDILNGLASNIGSGSNTFNRIGSIKINSADYISPATVIFEGIFEATSGQTAELRLYNVTDGAAVSGSTLSTTANSSDYKSAAITLASGTKIYEAQIRITNGSPSSGDGVICSNAKIRIK